MQPYSGCWNPKQYDRVNRIEGKLAGLDGFGEQIEHWLWQAIQQEFQLPESPTEVNPLDAETDLHERFLEIRTRHYVGRDDAYRRLREFAMASGEAPLLLTGESGLGKSAALARFVRDFRKEQPDAFLLAHFVGASPQTTSLAGMLQRLTQEVKRKFGLTLPQAESAEEIIRTFTVAILHVPELARVVLVLDALNQLDADSRADSLIWLPEKLPPNVRVLCSSATGPQQAPRILTAFGEREHVDVPLRPLNDEERRAIVKAVPKVVAKTLDDKQIDILLTNPATTNPLFLMVALEELRGYGSFERLNEMLAGLPRDGDAVTRLFDQVFERLEQEFNKPLVDWTLRLLACSRRGLRGPELVELTRSLGEQADDLYPVLRQLRAYLQIRDGLFDFYHVSVRRAVEIRYLRWNTDEDQRDPWARWNPDRQPPANAPTEQEKETRNRLIGFFETNRLAPRSVDEIPWNLAQLRGWHRLFDLMAELSFFNAAWQASESDVRTAWSLVKTVGKLEPIDAYRNVLAKPAAHAFDTLWNLAKFLEKSGYGLSVLPVWSFFIDRLRDDHVDSVLNDWLANLSPMLLKFGSLDGTTRLLKEALLSRCLVSQASILLETGDLEGAMRLLKETEEISRRLDDAEPLRASLGIHALILKATGDLDGAMRLHKEEEVICRRLNDSDALKGSLGNQALILKATGDLDGAMRLHKEGETICRRLGDLDGLSKSLDNQGLILQKIGDMDGAMRLHKEGETISRRLNDPAGLLRSFANQSTILLATGDLDGAMRLLKEQEAISRQLNDPVGLHVSLGNQAFILQANGDLDGAMRLLKEKEAICRRLNDPAELQISLGNRALFLQKTGDLDGAMRLFKENEAICRQLNDSVALRRSLENQASILQKTGDLDGAMRLLKETEAISRRRNDSAELQASLGNQAFILHKTGDLDGAMRLYKEHEATCRRLNDLAALQGSLGNQALILQATGNLDGAMRLLKEKEAICRRLDDPAELQISIGNQASILQNTGDLDGAMRLYKEHEAICRRRNDTTALQVSLGNQALIMRASGDLDGTMRLLKEQEAISRRLNDPIELSASLGNQALILHATGDPDGAMRLHKEEEAICRRFKNSAGLQRSLGNQALILQATGDLDGAMRLFKENEAICRQLNDPNGLAMSLANQAFVLAFRRSRPDEALQLVEEALRIATRYGLIPLARQIEPVVKRIRGLLK